jgi:hypothetical protein
MADERDYLTSSPGMVSVHPEPGSESSPFPCSLLRWREGEGGGCCCMSGGGSGFVAVGRGVDMRSGSDSSGSFDASPGVAAFVWREEGYICGSGGGAASFTVTNVDSGASSLAGGGKYLRRLCIAVCTPETK